MQFLPLILLFVGGLVLTIGDLFMKKWVMTSSTLLFTFGMAIYMVGLFFLAQSFKYKNIAVASVIFVIFNIVTLLIVSWFYFKERLSVMQLVGVAFGIIAILILELSS